LARPQVLDLMNANPLPGQQDGQGAAAQPIAHNNNSRNRRQQALRLPHPRYKVQYPRRSNHPWHRHPQMHKCFFPAVNMLSEERMLCPAPFSGRADKDATEFWRRFQNYLEFKPIVSDADKLRLIKAMCID